MSPDANAPRRSKIYAERLGPRVSDVQAAASATGAFSYFKQVAWREAR